MNSIEQLNSKFGANGAIQFEPGGGGLIRAVISSPLASAQVYLHGAHVTHYQPVGAAPVLFLSSKSNFTAQQAIRGGVPICFPWFAAGKDGNAPVFHGFARTTEWEVESAAKAPNGEITLTLMLQSNEATRAIWPCEFKARYTVRVGARLHLSLEVTNTGSGPFEFEEALHTYLSVADIRHVQVTGLEGTEYLDKAQDMKKVSQGANPITVGGEIDRIYLDTVAVCVAQDPVGKRKISVGKDGSVTTVVWTPGPIKAKDMPDMGSEDWMKMLCIETCNVKAAAVTLQPRQSHSMSAVI